MELMICMLIDSFLTISVGLASMRIYRSLKDLSLMTVVLGSLTFLLRWSYVKLNIPLGYHTFFIIILMILVMKIIGREKLLVGLFASLISMILLLIGEGFVLYNILRLFDTTLNNLLSYNGGRIIGTLLTNTLLIIGFILFYVRKKYIFDVNVFLKG